MEVSNVSSDDEIPGPFAGCSEQRAPRICLRDIYSKTKGRYKIAVSIVVRGKSLHRLSNHLLALARTCSTFIYSANQK
jgi:hypothetical protein